MTDGAQRLFAAAFDDGRGGAPLPGTAAISGAEARLDTTDDPVLGPVAAVDGRAVARRDVLMAAPSVRARADGLPPSLREICHDLRQPIATIQALAEAALCHRDLPGAVEMRLRHILSEARAMADLAHRLTADGLTLMPVSSADILAEVVEEAAVTYSGVIHSTAAGGPMMLADAVALRRALSNVLDNATRAAGPHGAVMANLVRNADALAFEISDTGVGFGGAPPGVASLGLGIAERIMRAHGGSIEIGRSSLGGALVRLVLPITADQRAVARTETAQ